MNDDKKNDNCNPNSINNFKIINEKEEEKKYGDGDENNNHLSEEILICKTPEREYEKNKEIETEQDNNNIDFIDVKMNYNILLNQKV